MVSIALTLAAVGALVETQGSVSASVQIGGFVPTSCGVRQGSVSNKALAPRCSSLAVVAFEEAEAQPDGTAIIRVNVTPR